MKHDDLRNEDRWLCRLLPLRPTLPLPEGMSAKGAFEFLNSIRVEHAPEAEMDGYCRHDWRRFLYTWGLVKDLSGQCLELGANPYFTTGLLREFTRLEMSLGNYFGPQFGSQAEQRVQMKHRGATELAWVPMAFHHFNVETDRFPFEDGRFDVVLFCEIIEHLQNDPLKVLGEIKRVLKPGGRLVLTTPNIARLENAVRLIGGKNISDPYSGYGPYGRHNREYTRQEIGSLLEWSGFEPELSFTADVHSNSAPALVGKPMLWLWAKTLWRRRADLGQYTFVRARNAGAMKPKRPGWLYRSYPAGEIEPC
ncbi:MAG: hypothetical protein A2107_09235 [Verrucomicrobia bacterium GWF2_62_7]|nr:MAG: hypothetical protein A2107_09235 [Verrucomicrobia bacterium GWF2_62_7]